MYVVFSSLMFYGTNNLKKIYTRSQRISFLSTQKMDIFPKFPHILKSTKIGDREVEV